MGDYWEDNNIEKPKQIVVCAACLNPYSGTIVLGIRHWDKLMKATFKALSGSAAGEWKQGFVDQFGDFLTRREAYKIVISNGQKFYPERNDSTEILYSEGLY